MKNDKQYKELIIISKKISDIRKGKGMSRDDLMKESGISRRTIQNVENGLGFSVKTLLDIAKALDMKPDYFLKELG